MNSFTRTSVFTIMVTGLVMLASAGSAATPEGVSPGAVDRVATIRGECPTFSWGKVDGTAFYEVVVYQLPEGIDLAAELELSRDQEVLYTRVVGNATAWTPDLERCFFPGGSYVWFVRAAFDEEGSPEAGEWSQGLFFSVAAAPSAAQVEQALDVLRRYLEQGDGEANELGALLSDARESTTLTPTGRTPPGKLAGKTLPGSAAIKAEMPDLTGRTYGVYGVTNSNTDGSYGVVGEATAESGQIYGIGGLSGSPAGAGVVAFNAADGPDVLLASGHYSASLTEAGLDRNSPSPVSFNFQNSSPTGTMTLRVDGVDVVTTLTDQDTTYSPGNQLDLVGTTFNVVEGSGSGLDADTLDSHDTDYFATAVHSHFGQTWTGSATHGLKAENSAGGGFGLVGWATAPTGANYGVFGKSNSNSGYGVWGWADAATGETYGVSGLSSSQVGHGVHGEASHSTGPTQGVSGESSSTNGIGVYGEATASSGPTRGVMGRSDSPDGRGVYGYAGDTTGENSGVFGQTASAAGYGVYGENTAGGLAGFFVGDVAQSESAGGLVKAAAEVFCGFGGSSVNRSINLVPDAGPITITNGFFTGSCYLDFGFPLNDRFWSVSATSGPRIPQCSVDVDNNLFCSVVDLTGSLTDSLLVVIVF